eukprot:FR736910.1.p1 GENE.FR736910.1~~FR736910.1.p1  ORF type:complete len:114 (-),score=8.42 FR736910.1:146-487(-)
MCSCATTNSTFVSPCSGSFLFFTFLFLSFSLLPFSHCTTTKVTTTAPLVPNPHLIQFGHHLSQLLALNFVDVVGKLRLLFQTGCSVILSIHYFLQCIEGRRGQQSHHQLSLTL